MNSILIAILAAVLLVVLILILKKIATKEAPPVEIGDEDITALPVEEVVGEKEDFAESVQEVVEEAAKPQVEEVLSLDSDIAAEPELEVENEVEAKAKEEPSIEVEQSAVEQKIEVEAGAEQEDIVESAQEVVDEIDERLTEEELSLEPETVVEGELIEPESAGQSDIVDQPELIEEAEVEEKARTVQEELSFDIEEHVIEDEIDVNIDTLDTESVVALSVESHEQRLLALREIKQAALNEAMENNEEKRREQLQVEFVAITEALDFLDQSYEQEVSCRNDALVALKQMQGELEAKEYERAWESIGCDETPDAEQIFDALVNKSTPLSALAAYQSGCLAECRMDFNRAMERFEKAVSIDGDNPDYLRSAAMLARKLYRHKNALAWFGSLEKVLEERGEESVELALARRELAYSTALVGRHKQAGGLYKKAMISLSKLLGKQDPELGICWYQIGKLQEALGKYDMAEEPYKKALALMEKNGRNVIMIDILGKLAGLYMELERESEAIMLYERLCAYKEESPNPDNATLIVVYNNLGEAYKFSGRYEEAETKYKRALVLTEELRGKEHAAVGSILQQLVMLCQKQKKMEEADAHQARATAIFQRVVEEQEAAGQQGVSITLPD